MPMENVSVKMATIFMTEYAQDVLLVLFIVRLLVDASMSAGKTVLTQYRLGSAFATPDLEF